MYKTMLSFAVVGTLCFTAPSTMAQDTSQTASGSPLVAQPNTAAPAVVPKGTPIVVEITDLISSKTAQRDDMFNLKLAEPVMLNGDVVIPAGTPGKGQVIDAAKPGMGGKPGKLVLAARYLEYQGKQITIHGLTMDITGKDNTNASMAVGVAVGVFGLAVTGGNMEVQPGMRGHAKLGSDFVPADVDLPAPEAQANSALDASITQTNTTADSSSAAQANP